MASFRNFKVLNAFYNIYVTSMDIILEQWDREDREDTSTCLDILTEKDTKKIIKIKI